LAGVAALATFAPLGTAHAGVTVLYAFKGGSDGCYPDAGLLEDKSGNLYGTTSIGGGEGSGCYGNTGHGTVFKLAPNGNKTVLHVFAGPDGAGPSGDLIADKASNLYGTTGGGGAYGYGTVFRLAPDGTHTVLYSFAGEGDGAYPYAGLVRDARGNLYGTTYQTDGQYCENSGDCGGTVFQIAPDGTETVLHAFTGEQTGDGADPTGGLILDKDGNLYGTTSMGGTTGCEGEYEPNGCGTFFKIAPDGTETLLYAFRGRKHGDGSYPGGNLIRDDAGNFYGTTGQGGQDGCHPYHGCGTVFQLAPDGTETVLYAFAGGRDGAVPFSGLIRDEAGNLYGTTAGGGGTGGQEGCKSTPQGCGTVFKLAPDGTETVLFDFADNIRDGIDPRPKLMRGADGKLYGTAFDGGVLTDCTGGAGCGTVFRLEK
jgi:uncharacterized repeat protein (TIGR03803 family)